MWSDMYGLDFSLMKGYLMEEAIVDIVEPNTIVTNSYCILDLNLYNCTINDTEFSTNFQLLSLKNDFIHAFVFWFDVIFTCCNKPLTLTTNPKSFNTHWKQTILYTKSDINVQINDHINGIISIRKNPNNKRDVDIKITYDVNCKYNNIYSS